MELYCLDYYCHGILCHMIILLKFSLRDIPPEAAVFVTNAFLVIFAFLWAIYRGVKITDHLALISPPSTSS